MAKEATVTNLPTETAAAPRTRRAPEGPRKIKPLHVALKITDASGNPVEGAKVEIVAKSKEFENVYTAKEADSSVILTRIPLDNIA